MVFPALLATLLRMPNGVLDHQQCLRHNHARWYPGLPHLCKVQAPLIQLVAQLLHPRVVALSRPAGKSHTLLGVDNPAPVTAIDYAPARFLQCLSGRSFYLVDPDATCHSLLELRVFAIARAAPPAIFDEHAEPLATSSS